MESIWNRPTTFPGCFPDISRVFPGHFPGVSRTFFFKKKIADVSRTFPGCFPDISRTFPGYFPDIFPYGIHMGSIWNPYGFLMNIVRDF